MYKKVTVLMIPVYLFNAVYLFIKLFNLSDNKTFQGFLAILVLCLSILYLISYRAERKRNADKTSSSDGVITTMRVEELISKLSKLDKNTTMSDLIDMFGKEPRMVVEINSDLWEYFSGKIIIKLSGINLQDGRLCQATVSSAGSNITIDLED